MKKFALLVLAFCLALIVNELAVRYLLRYPFYGIEKKVMGIRDSENRIQNIFKPYSKYLNVEGGNKIYNRNNLGLYGEDVNIGTGNKYIVILGSSFVEAMQVHPSKMASSIFFDRIKEHYQVINLGHSGQDPYDNYLRLQYFAQFYKPDKVILIIQDIYSSWLDRHPYPLEFSKPKDFGKEPSGASYIIQKSLRNNIASFNLFAEYLRLSKSNDKEGGESLPIDNHSVHGKNVNNFSKLYDCLSAYKSKYNGNFLCISIITDQELNNQLERWCGKNKINFTYNNNVCLPENRFNKTGHLNYTGNKLLGDFIYESFTKTYSKP